MNKFNIAMKFFPISRIYIFYYVLFFNTLTGYCLFQTVFKQRLIDYFSFTSDKLDREYYSILIQNLTYPFISIIFLLAFFFFIRRFIKRLFTFLFNHKKFIYLITGLVIIIQLLFIFFIDNAPFADSVYYLQHAERFLKDGSYTNQFGNLTAFWPVGYPIYLAGIQLIFGNELIFIKVINIFISISLLYVLYHFFKNRLKIQHLNLFIFISAIYPGFLFSSNIIMPDYLSAFLIWFSVFLYIKQPYKKANILLSGLVLGFGILVRPTFMILPFLFLIFTFYRKKKELQLKNYLIFVFGVVLIISPWLIRNYSVFNKIPVIATNGGYNFLMGNHSNSIGKVNFNFEYDLSNPDEVAVENNAYLRGWTAIKEAPVEAIVRAAKKVFYSYYRGDSSVTWIFKENINNYNPILVSSIFFTTNYIHWIIIVLSIAGSIRLFKLLKSIEMIYLSLILFYFLIIIALFVGNERYIVTILPLHFLSATLFLSDGQKEKN